MAADWHIAELDAPGEAQLVSVIVPCRNERAHIEDFCRSALAQQLPAGWRMELLVADGASDDGTRELLDEYAARDARLTVLDNPQRIVSSGLNAALRRARGSVIARLDVHTRFAPDYLAECLAALERTGADNVGGPWVAQGQGAAGRAIAAAFQCRWVVGGARSRDTSYEGEADTVYLGCWRREALARAGGFDEALVRNQDDEHNLRLRRAAARVWQSARIRSVYQPRGTLRQLWAQQWQYGYWRAFVLRRHGRVGAWRQLVPAAFVAALLAGILAAPWCAAPLIALLAAYGAYLLAASISAARAAPEKDAAMLLRLPAAIALYHCGYGAGFWRGLLDALRGKQGSAEAARLTR